MISDSPAKNIDQGGFAGAGRTHQRHPLASLHAETHTVQCAQSSVLFDERVYDYLRGMPGAEPESSALTLHPETRKPEKYSPGAAADRR